MNKTMNKNENDKETRILRNICLLLSNIDMNNSPLITTITKNKNMTAEQKRRHWDQIESIPTKDIEVQVFLKNLKLSRRELQLQKENRILKKRLHRRNDSITSMKSFLQYLRKNSIIMQIWENILKTNFNAFSFNLLQNELRNSKVVII